MTDLRPLTDLPLTILWIPGCKHVTDFSSLSLLAELRHLYIRWTEIEDLGPLQNLSRLTHLDLGGCGRLSDLRPLASLPNLRELVLEDAAPGLDLSPLAANRKLEVTIEPGQDVRGAEALGRRLKLR